MRTSIVVRSRNEAPRLRLTLASLETQCALDEVIVVNDGSTDDTRDVLAAAQDKLQVVPVHHAQAHGRSAASNAGAKAATGDILIFLDGDTLAAPGMVAAHAEAHRNTAAIIGRGETWHVRSTRMLADPETGTFWPVDVACGNAMPSAERAAMRITRTQITDDFDAIARRGAPGVYPGAAPRRLHEEEMRALTGDQASRSLWAAASGSNLSMRRATFLNAGGFDPALDINEHRELAYRLCAVGVRMVAVPNARSYHMTHRSGWRDPLADDAWERQFLSRHPEAPIAALKTYWAAMSAGKTTAKFFA